MKKDRKKILFAHSDIELFKQVINAKPYAFITKTFEKKDLQRGIETALNRMKAEGLWKVSIKHSPEKAHNHKLSGFQ